MKVAMWFAIIAGIIVLVGGIALSILQGHPRQLFICTVLAIVNFFMAFRCYDVIKLRQIKNP